MITLIIPPSGFLLNEKVFVSLGVLYVAAALEEKGYETKVVDLKGQKDWADEVREVALQDNDLIGITATSADFPIALQILKIIKSINKGVQVIIGGPHATIAPQHCEMYDKVIIGDGVTGIIEAFKSDKRFVHGEMVKDLDGLPLPARHLVDLNSYSYEINGRKATNVMSQFGCPYRCIFCCGRNIKEYKTVRHRSPSNFIAELDFLNDRYGYTAFMVHDDEFNLNEKRTKEMCEILSRKDFLFRAFIRADLFTDEIAKSMAKAGFFQVDAGVESGSRRVLKTIRKGTTPEINSEALRLAKKYGIKFKAFITIGHPSETLEDILMTKQWLLDNKPDAFEIYVITPYPGAPIYDQKEKYDLEFSIDYSHDITSVTRRYGEYRSYVRNSYLKSEEIARIWEEMDMELRAELGLPATEEIANNTPNNIQRQSR